jgi:hypothetical protein
MSVGNDEATSGDGLQRPCEEVLLDPNRGRLVFNWHAISHNPIGFLRASGPFLTAHHPFCSEYEGHVFTFLGRKWCIGCFFNSLSFFSSFALMIVLWVLNPLLFDRAVLFYTGVFGVILSFLLSVSGLTKKKTLKAISKLILGASFSFIVVFILIAGGDIFYLFELKVLLVLLFYMPVIGLLSAKQMIEMQKGCESCDYKMRWSRCPGFAELVCDLVDQGFIAPRPKGGE